MQLCFHIFLLFSSTHSPNKFLFRKSTIDMENPWPSNHLHLQLQLEKHSSADLRQGSSAPPPPPPLPP